MIACLPRNEMTRLAALERYRILDTEAEQSFDDLTTLAAQICDTPIALVSLVDRDRQWFKSKVGLAVTETSRDWHSALIRFWMTNPSSLKMH